jgi:hypothetical protein
LPISECEVIHQTQSCMVQGTRVRSCSRPIQGLFADTFLPAGNHGDKGYIAL